MKNILISLRKKYQESHAALIYLREHYEEELEAINCRIDCYSDSGQQVLGFAERSSTDVIKQINKVLAAIPESKKKTRPERKSK